jgi:hypothetical protein
MHQNTYATVHTKIGEKFFSIYLHQLIHLTVQQKKMLWVSLLVKMSHKTRELPDATLDCPILH